VLVFLFYLCTRVIWTFPIIKIVADYYLTLTQFLLARK
jgi:hypothetical protein